ncbi:hypothetical protein [Adhaeribacter radiodurans]|uniref:Uncharacterized protein n=1 Tax=Adhaeribacter radiodurans TaxID=2745197 RepID=A0A7L7L5V1_9BACT|nr:hypothetical protein [Adhaeribacter radiodurans]QMU28134.1 hypothetical protein HUW48_08790 [Adhaeribacter radiodurans]
MKTNKGLGFIHPIATYAGVKVVHLIMGFHYDPFQEGLLTYKLLIDILSWGIIAVLTYFLSKWFFPEKNNSI